MYSLVHLLTYSMEQSSSYFMSGSEKDFFFKFRPVSCGKCYRTLLPFEVAYGFVDLLANCLLVRIDDLLGYDLSFDAVNFSCDRSVWNE